MKQGLSKNEWILMNVLWDSEEPMVISEIIDKLKDQVPWSYSTYMTQLERLVGSGYLKFQKRGRTRFFYPAVPMKECVERENQGISERMPERAANQLLVCLLRDASGVSPEEISELEHLVELLKEKNND